MQAVDERLAVDLELPDDGVLVGAVPVFDNHGPVVVATVGCADAVGVHHMVKNHASDLVESADGRSAGVGTGCVGRCCHVFIVMNQVSHCKYFL